MAITRTTNLKLQKPGAADRNWGGPLNDNLDALDAAATVSALAVTTAETPSTTRGLAIAPGPYLKPDGTTGAYAGGTTTAPASGTSYVSIASTDGSIAVGAAWPTSPHVRLAVVIADANKITSISDARCVLNVALAPSLPLSGGTMADGAVIAAATATGLQIAGATSQKLGFYGKAPVAQPSVPAATASGSYGATEQAMLQAVYNAIRDLGLGG